MHSSNKNLFEWFKKLLHKEPSNQSYKCGICGKIHGGLPMDMAYKNPANYFKIPPNERAKRIKITDDVCVIDNNEFYIRGVLPIPVIDSDKDFRWGTWARVEEGDFKTYLKYWDGNIPENFPPLIGYLSGGLKDYPESDMISVEIYLQSGNQRPFFKVLSSESSLGVDQEKGITMEKVHSFVEPLLK
ncbi:MAG: DUF2199 domain-containing protein [Caldilineaceae bacterium]